MKRDGLVHALLALVVGALLFSPYQLSATPMSDRSVRGTPSAPVELLLDHTSPAVHPPDGVSSRGTLYDGSSTSEQLLDRQGVGGQTDSQRLDSQRLDSQRGVSKGTQREFSPIERRYRARNLTLNDRLEGVKVDRTLSQFGYDFFENSRELVKSFELMPVPPSYALGPGDTLVLSLWGAIDASHELLIDRNGQVTIPKVGPVVVAGKTVDEAHEAISRTLSRTFRNFESSLAIGRLKGIQVFVVGEVQNPGVYTISPFSSVINALAVAGGPTRNGSLRSIRVSEPGEKGRLVDLYDVLLSGNPVQDQVLRNGDTLFVPVITRTVAVSGEVRRPAIYEITEGASVKDAISLAGGFSPGAGVSKIHLERYQDDGTKTIREITLPEGEEEPVRDGDMIKVYPSRETLSKVVVLKGNVRKGGEYPFHEGMRIGDLIPSAEELLPDSFLDSVEIIRVRPPEFRKELVTTSLKKVFDGDTAANIPLMDQDTVVVRSRTEMEPKQVVTISGAVTNPGVYEYLANMTVRDLITRGGALRRNAITENAEISRIGREGNRAVSVRLAIDLAQAMAGDPEHNITLAPDDVLFVRSVEEWAESTENFVVLKGEVRYPGIYAISKGERLSSVIKRAGGFTDKAYLRGAKFIRESVRKEQQKNIAAALDRAEADIRQKQAALASTAASKEELDATKAALEGLQKTIEKLRTKQAEGRVVLKLSPLERFKGSEYDITLEGGDTLTIPPRPAVVSILGQVYNPTAIIHRPSLDVESVLQKAGGPTSDAENSEIYLVRADGSVESRLQSSLGFKCTDDREVCNFGGFLSTPVEPGDTVVVPQKIERISWMRDIKDITQILANVAVTVGTVLVGLK